MIYAAGMDIIVISDPARRQSMGTFFSREINPRPVICWNVCEMIFNDDDACYHHHHHPCGPIRQQGLFN